MSISANHSLTFFISPKEPNPIFCKPSLFSTIISKYTKFGYNNNNFPNNGFTNNNGEDLLDRSSNSFRYGHRNFRSITSGRLSQPTQQQSGDRLFTNKVIANIAPSVRASSVRMSIVTPMVRTPSVRAPFIGVHSVKAERSADSEAFPNGRMVQQPASMPANPTYQNSSIQIGTRASTRRFIKQSLNSHKSHEVGKWVRRPLNQPENLSGRNNRAIAKLKVDKWIKKNYHFISTFALKLIDEIFFLWCKVNRKHSLNRDRFGTNTPKLLDLYKLLNFQNKNPVIRLVLG